MDENTRKQNGQEAKDKSVPKGDSTKKVPKTTNRKPPKHKGKSKRIDYLQEMKKNRGYRTSSKRKIKLDKEILEKTEGGNLEQIKNYKTKVDRIEQEAYRKEQQLEKKQNGGSIKDTFEVSDMLLDTIKAKLALLDTI